MLDHILRSNIIENLINIIKIVQDNIVVNMISLNIISISS